jgi:polyhydroxyalkanoate synthase
MCITMQERVRTNGKSHAKTKSKAKSKVRRKAQPLKAAPAPVKTLAAAAVADALIKSAKAAPAPSASPSMADPEDMARDMLRMLETGGRAMTGFLSRAGASANPVSTASEVSEASQTLADLYQRWMSDPVRFAEQQGALMRDYMELWNNTLKRTLGQPVKALVEPEPGDNRFKDPEWNDNPYFDFWKQAYLLTARWSEQMLRQTEGLDDRARHKADFLLRQMAAAFAPSNFPFTNPEVIRETIASNGQNLVKGMTNLAGDLEKSDSMLSISQTDTTAFEVGRNIAVTPGKVVFQNDIIQLIQYQPTTETVLREPLLIVPPWINKFYILDLTQERSFIKFAVDQGITVFVVSWVNPDKKLAEKTFEDYMKEGILAAADAVTEETGVENPHIIGYCVGGTLLSTTLAYLAAKGEERFQTATYFAAQSDFTKAGDLKLFIDDDQLKSLDKIIAEKGYLEGSRMATVFNMLRPKDLIWPYIVNNYMLGKKPFPFDLLYWNQDSTRMPAANHKFYLREFYHENKLAKGELSIAGEKLDMTKVTLPVYMLAAREDHIAPAESVFIGARLFGGPVRFVLGGSGHIAGVINPPGKVKYQYWTSDSMAGTFQGWMKGAKETPGSWWPDWANWIKEHSTGEVAARKPGQHLKPIEDAPGSYVKVKS